MDTDWSKIIFSDESKFLICGLNKKLWIHINDVVINRVVKYPLKMNVWGCFYNKKLGPIVVFKENLNSNGYTEILNNNLIPFIEKSKRDLIFQHDNDPKHTAGITKLFLKEHNVNVLEWPSCSPDLNPIENIWKLLKERVSKHKTKKGEEFIKIIIKEWNKIDTRILESLINSMPNRINEVIKNKGDVIFY